MANTKISELTALTTPVGADVLPIVDDTGDPSSIETKKVSVTNLILTSTQTLTNKTLTDCDASTQSAGNNTTKIATTAFVTTAAAASDTLSEILANGNTSGATDIVVTAGQAITTDTISETTSAAGVTIDGVVLKDTAVTTGAWNGSTVGVAYGGTGATSLTDGGILLGSGTGAITAMTALADSEMIVGDGTTDPVAESGATLRTSIGVAIGSDVQAWDAELDTLAALTEARGSLIVGNSTPAWSALAAGSANTVLTSDGTDAAWGTVTNSMLAGSIANAKLANSAVTVGSTSISLGATATTIAGLTSVTSTTFVGALTGNCSGTAATVTGAAQTAITSVGTLTALTVGSASGNAILTLDCAAANDNIILLKEDGSETGRITLAGADNQMSFTTAGTERITVEANGDIAFNNDSGNPKVFWDASTGFLGVGQATASTYNLEVSGTVYIAGDIKIVDGTQGDGKVLTSDADGLATWVAPTTGDITGVTAGTNLNGGGTSGDVTLNLDNPVVANLTGNASGSSGSCTGNAATVTTNANLTGDVTSSGNATTIATGAVDIAMLSATGTASSSTYLRGDNAWTAISGSGDVSKVGTPVDNQVGVWTGDGTIEGTTGLTFDGATLNLDGSANAILILDRVGVNDSIILFKEDGSEKGRITLAGSDDRMGFTTAGTERLVLAANGDITFNNDSGNAKFTFDASSGMVGLGTAVPATELHIQGSGAQEARVESTDGNAILALDAHTNSDCLMLFKEAGTEKGRITLAGSDDRLAFKTGAVERLAIAANGDISFNNDSGNPKIFWDASTGFLGVAQATASTYALEVTGAGYFTGQIFGAVTALSEIADVEIDFDGTNLQTLEVTGTCNELSTTNLAAGKTVEIRIYSNNSDGYSDFTPTTPSWKEIANSISTVGVAYGEYGILKLTSWGTADTDVTAELQTTAI